MLVGFEGLSVNLYFVCILSISPLLEFAYFRKLSGVISPDWMILSFFKFRSFPSQGF